MKKYTVICVIVGATLVCSCVSLKKAVQSPPVVFELDKQMELIGNQLSVNFVVNVPEEHRNNHTGTQIKPILIGKDTIHQCVELPTLVVEGRQHERFNERLTHYDIKHSDSISVRIPYSHRGSTTYNYSCEVPYELWMKDSKLYLKVYADAYTRRVELTDVEYNLPVTDWTDYIVLEPKIRFYKEVTPVVIPDISDTFIVAFPLDSEQLDINIFVALKTYLTQLQINPMLSDYSLELIVVNSPEGSLAYNHILGEKRVYATQQMLRSFGLTDKVSKLSLIEEDWDGLKSFLSTSGWDQSADMQEVLSSETDLDKREKVLRTNFPQEFKRLQKECFPQLRRAEIVVTTHYKANNDNNQYEQESRTIDFNRANQGMTYMQDGLYEDARIMFQLVDYLPEVRYNLGLIAMMNQEWEKADSYIAEFADLNSVLVKLAIGQYQAAADILRSLPDSSAKTALEELLQINMK